MLSLLVVCLGLVASGEEGSADPRDLAAYEAAQAKAGHDARAHVRLALWCESHGMSAERMKHLAMAVLYDPSNGLARGLLGLVAYRGKWDRPDVVGREIQETPAYRDLIREYTDRRAATARKPDAQARLASWCEQKGLKEQSIAHYMEAVRLDPSREATWRHLGYRKQGDRWVKPGELAAERLEAEHQRHADKHWEPKLKRLREGLEARDPTHRARAEAAIAEVTDPRAVPMIWAVFVRGGERSRLAAVQMLGQIDGPTASNALAALAVYNASAGVRGRAIETLARRDPRDILGRLIGLVRKPFKYDVRRPGGPGTTGELFVEGERFNVQRFYRNPSVDPRMIPARIFAPSVPFDPYSVPNQMLVSAAFGGMSIVPTNSGSNAAQIGHALAANPQNAAAILKNGTSGTAGSPGLGFNPSSNVVYDTLAAAAYRDMQIASAYQAIEQKSENLQQRLALDIQMVETTNAQIGEINGRVLPILKMISGQDFGAEPETWKTWWTDQLGYVYQSNIPEIKPTFTDTVTVATPFLVGTCHTACFAAGTLVSTLDGPRAIESIRVGDRVLSQDTTTGALAFQPVIALHLNRPTATFRIAIDGESIVATGIHRFWKAGKGWTMARDLKPGDLIRVIGGVARVQSIAPDAVQPVYNLDVAESRDFFVGTRAFLVHDFSFVQPVMSPFDRSSLVISH
ncbi:MAG: polymorphic toxin-type HINT domain-containing protein [Isosphaeraceae bacterium]